MHYFSFSTDFHTAFLHFDVESKHSVPERYLDVLRAHSPRTNVAVLTDEYHAKRARSVAHG
jgi:hypothetical protein